MAKKAFAKNAKKLNQTRRVPTIKKSKNGAERTQLKAGATAPVEAIEKPVVPRHLDFSLPPLERIRARHELERPERGALGNI